MNRLLKWFKKPVGEDRIVFHPVHCTLYPVHCMYKIYNGRTHVRKTGPPALHVFASLYLYNYHSSNAPATRLAATVLAVLCTV